MLEVGRSPSHEETAPAMGGDPCDERHGAEPDVSCAAAWLAKES